jgi:hypothetical protein
MRSVLIMEGESFMIKTASVEGETTNYDNYLTTKNLSLMELIESISLDQEKIDGLTKNETEQIFRKIIDCL